MKTKLMNAFGGASLLLLTGCATTTSECMVGANLGVVSFTTFSEKCAASKFANAAAQSNNPEMRVLGTTVMRNQNKEVNIAASEVVAGKGAPAPVQASGNCVVTGISENKRKDGPKTAQLVCQ